MPADGKVKYNAWNSQCCNMGVDDYPYRYTAYDAAHDKIRIIGEREREQRQLDIQASNAANHAGFVAKESVRNLGTFTHPKYGHGKLIGVEEGAIQIDFPDVGVICIAI